VRASAACLVVIQEESYVHEVYLKLKLTLHSPLVIHFVVATNSPTVRAGCALQVLCLD